MIGTQGALVDFQAIYFRPNLILQTTLCFAFNFNDTYIETVEIINCPYGKKADVCRLFACDFYQTKIEFCFKENIFRKLKDCFQFNFKKLFPVKGLPFLLVFVKVALNRKVFCENSKLWFQD